MKDLPLEIIGLIVQHVNRDDYYHCLLVSKFWFLVFQRLLYKEVKPLETQQLHLFLESLTLYPRCMEAGAYVKQLDMSLLSGADKFKINSSKEIGFVDALKHCPNLETLSIYSTHEVIQSMKDPRIPGLKKLVVFSLDPLNRYRKDTYQIMDCYYRFSSTLTHLHLDNISDTNAEGLDTYLASFVCLENLYIDLSSNSLKSSSLLDDILRVCPNLTHLYYNCKSFTPPDNLSIQEYPGIKEFQLTVGQFNIESANYIKQRLIHLNGFVLNILKKLDDELEVLGLLMQIEATNKFKVEIHKTYSRETVNTFWKHIQYHPHYSSVTREAVFWTNTYSNTSSIFNVTRCPFTGTKIATSKINSPARLGLEYADYLGEIGYSLDTLEIRNIQGSFRPNLHLINLMCPTLSRLYIACPELAIHSLPIRSNCQLDTLILSHCEITNSTFKAIESAYPQLQSLHLSSTKFKMDNTQEKVYHLQLPAGLKSIKMQGTRCQNTAEKVMVVKELKDEQCLWHLNNQQVTVVGTNNIFSVIQQYSSDPLYLLKSSSVEYVQVDS